MFELPNNTTPQLRPEVVNRLVAAMFTKGHLDYCDEYVSMDGDPGLRGYHDGPRPESDKRIFKAFTDDERKAAFEEFRQKGYHIIKETWWGARHRLWSYVVKETKDYPGDRDNQWLF